MSCRLAIESQLPRASMDGYCPARIFPEQALAELLAGTVLRVHGGAITLVGQPDQPVKGSE